MPLKKKQIIINQTLFNVLHRQNTTINSYAHLGEYSQVGRYSAYASLHTQKSGLFKFSLSCARKILAFRRTLYFAYSHHSFQLRSKTLYAGFRHHNLFILAILHTRTVYITTRCTGCVYNTQTHYDDDNFILFCVGFFLLYIYYYYLFQ